LASQQIRYPTEYKKKGRIIRADILLAGYPVHPYFKLKVPYQWGAHHLWKGNTGSSFRGNEATNRSHWKEEVPVDITNAAMLTTELL
jgi:hypothetical protein